MSSPIPLADATPPIADAGAPPTPEAWAAAFAVALPYDRFLDRHATPEQRERLGAVLREERERLAALRDDRELAPRERYRRFREAREEVNHRVKGILTPEQFARWERLRAAEPGQARGGADRKSR